MLVVPVMNNGAFFGVLQVTYNYNQSVTKFEEGGAQQLCSTLVIAIRQRMKRLGDKERKKPLSTMSWSQTAN